MASLKKWRVEFEMKPFGSIVYSVFAPTKPEAKKLACDRYAIECRGYKVRKVAIKEAEFGVSA